MRKIFLIALFIMGMLSFNANAQFEGIGVKYGFNFGTPISKIVEGASATPGFSRLNGAFVRFRLKEKITLQAEMQISLKASEFTTPIEGDTVILQFIPNVGYLPFPADFSGVVEGQFRNHYLEIPLVARYEAGENWAILGGLYGAYLLQGDNSGLADIELGQGFDFREDEPFDQTEFLFPWDYGVVAGGEYRRNGFQFDLRATIGLRSIYQNDYAQVSNSVWNGYLQGSVGYFFEMSK